MFTVFCLIVLVSMPTVLLKLKLLSFISSRYFLPRLLMVIQMWEKITPRFISTVLNKSDTSFLENIAWKKPNIYKIRQKRLLEK